MRLLLIFAALFSVHVSAHEIQSITQHVDIKKQKETGWQQDVLATFNLSKKVTAGAQATYLERFSFYEKRAGLSLGYRPDEKWNLQFRYLQGMGNVILPEKQGIFSAYYSLASGLTPFVYLRDTRYSLTHLNTAQVGLEIEKIKHIILVPSVMFGKATFNSPSKTDDVQNFGLRAIYYIDQLFSLAVFGFKGREASQGIIGQSTVLVDTTSAGISGMTYFMQNKLRAELTIDHTDYDQLHNQFLTTTLNLTWMF